MKKHSCVSGLMARVAKKIISTLRLRQLHTKLKAVICSMIVEITIIKDAFVSVYIKTAEPNNLDDFSSRQRIIDYWGSVN